MKVYWFDTTGRKINSFDVPAALLNAAGDDKERLAIWIAADYALRTAQEIGEPPDLGRTLAYFRDRAEEMHWDDVLVIRAGEPDLYTMFFVGPHAKEYAGQALCHYVNGSAREEWVFIGGS